MINPILSIVISTLNRKTLLEELIQSVINQNTSEIEILLSDGGSSDGTTQYIRNLEIKYSFVRLIKSDRKLGLDEGYHICCLQAKGSYIWCLPDDDVLYENSIKEIIHHLTFKPDLLLLNIRCYSKTLNTDLGNNLFKIENDLSLNREGFFSYFSNHIPGLSYMGSFILSREIWQESQDILHRYYGSWFIVFATVINSSKLQNIYFKANPVIKYRSANSSWTNHSFEIWNKIWPQLIISCGLFEPTIVSSNDFKYPWARIRTTLKSRAVGGYSFQAYKQHIHKNYCVTGFSKFILFLISFFPVQILNFLSCFYLIFIKNDSLYSTYTVIMESKFKNIFLKITGIN